MKNSIALSSKTAVIFTAALAAVSATAWADRGRGTIRAAPPRVVVHEAPHVEARRDVHVDVHEAHPEPAHVEVRRDWDDNDEDARHFGGYAGGTVVHINRGERFHQLPAHYFHLFFNNQNYFLDDTGAYYVLQPDGEYIVVQPPTGVVVTAVPSGATPIVVGPTTYFYLDGVYYVAQGPNFDVVNPPPGIVVPSLPTGANQVVINGNLFYQFNGFNYQPSLQDGVTVYTVNPG